MPGASLTIDDPSGHYKRVEIETASPAKLLLMLYDTAVQRCESAAESLRRRELEPAHFHLLRVQDILTELMAALDLDVPEAPVRELFALYDYMHRTLVRANIEKNPDPIDQVAAILTQLRQAWAEATVASTDLEEVSPSPPAHPRKIDLQT